MRSPAPHAPQCCTLAAAPARARTRPASFPALLAASLIWPRCSYNQIGDDGAKALAGSLAGLTALSALHLA
jgi:hypothetical protein